MILSKIDTEDFCSDLSLMVCHCGWAKMTTYRGLRIHQGKMGCTAKGMKIPKKEEYDEKNLWDVEGNQKQRQPSRRAIVKKEVYYC